MVQGPSDEATTAALDAMIHYELGRNAVGLEPARGLALAAVHLKRKGETNAR
jgi:hypothetical protein